MEINLLTKYNLMDILHLNSLVEVVFIFIHQVQVIPGK